MTKIIITIAPTGPYLNKKDSLFVPITTDEIVSDIEECYNLGATVVHLNTIDRKDFELSNIVSELKKNCPDIIIQVDTDGNNKLDYYSRKRKIGLNLNIESASLNIESNYNSTVLNNKFNNVTEKLINDMLLDNIKPQIEVSRPETVLKAIDMKNNGILTSPYNFNFIINKDIDNRNLFINFSKFLKYIPKDSSWTIIGKGDKQMMSIFLGICFGGNIRVGLEDNVYYQNKIIAKNSEFVKRVIKLANEYGREIANPAESRDMMFIKQEISCEIFGKKDVV